MSDLPLVDHVRQRLLDDPDVDSSDLPVRERVTEHAARLVREVAPLLSPEEHERAVEGVVAEVAGLGPIDAVLRDPDVTEVMVNGPARAWVERAGRIEHLEVGLDESALLRLVERIVTPLGLRCDRTTPVADARLPDGSRVHAVIPPVAVDGPYLTIRRFVARRLPLDAFGVPTAVRRLLLWSIAAGWNVLVAGGTGSGKTTLLNSLSSAIDAGERIVTVEETAELRLDQPHVVRLEARPPNAEGVGGVSVRELVRASLRMRPDRVVVGEVRGGEALDMLDAMNTGHDGSLSTIHANGPAEALLRLEALALRASGGLPLDAVRAQIATSVDAVVQVARDREGARRVTAVAEVASDGDRPGVRMLYRYGEVAVTPPRRAARRFDAPGFRAFDA